MKIWEKISKAMDLKRIKIERSGSVFSAALKQMKEINSDTDQNELY